MQGLARIPLSWITALLIVGCASQADHPSLEQIQAATARAEQGIAWIGLGTDARGRNYSILQRDLRFRSGPTPEIWVRRDAGLGTASGVADHLWRFDCQARTSQILSQKLYRADWSVRSTRNLDRASTPAAPGTIESVLLDAVCLATERAPSHIHP